MLIRKLHIKNFKSIKEADIEFSSLTLLVGANASGKSNLINVFRFISNIANDGIDNAVALQGGIPYLANMSLPKGNPIEIGFTLDLSKEEWVKKTYDKNIGLKIQEITYRFVIQPNFRGHGYHIASDNLKLDFTCLRINQTAKKEERYTSMDTQFSLHFEKKKMKSSVQVGYEVNSTNNIVQEKDIKENLKKNDWSSKFFCEVVDDNKEELMLYHISILLPSVFSTNNFIRVFDFDPNELKKPSAMASMRILEENGSNIASVLHNILRFKENRNKLTTILNDFLPFINGITIENNLDKSYSYKVQERFNKQALHANFLSDGTVSIIALIIALYFEKQSNIIILEEPERNIHPKLLENLLYSAEDVSNDKQIIITTHNPEFLKHAKIENVVFIKRNNEGFTIVSSPKDSENVKCFMCNDLGLDELFLQNLLEK